MVDIFSRREAIALRARVAVLDRAIGALIETAPDPAAVFEILRKDLAEIDTAFTSMRLVLPEQEGDREALRDAVKADLLDMMKRLGTRDIG